MPFDGNMLFNLRSSDFDIRAIDAYDSNGNQLASVEAELLILQNVVHGEEYMIIFRANDGVSGIFDLRVSCTSDAPSQSPTTPSDSSIAHHVELTCGSRKRTTGAYNGSPLNVEVSMPYDGHIMMDLAGSDFEIGSITVLDSDGNKVTGSEISASILTVRNLRHDGYYTFIIEGVGYVYTGKFDIIIECSSDAPTTSPTKPPGCCKRGSGRMNPRCELLATESGCNKRSDVCNGTNIVVSM